MLPLKYQPLCALRSWSSPGPSSAWRSTSAQKSGNMLRAECRKALPPTVEPWTPTTGIKVVIDQFVQAPVFTVLIFAFLGFLEGKNAQAIQKQSAKQTCSQVERHCFSLWVLSAGFFGNPLLATCGFMALRLYGFAALWLCSKNCTYGTKLHIKGKNCTSLIKSAHLGQKLHMCTSKTAHHAHLTCTCAHAHLTCAVLSFACALLIRDVQFFFHMCSFFNKCRHVLQKIVGLD